MFIYLYILENVDYPKDSIATSFPIFIFDCAVSSLLHTAFSSCAVQASLVMEHWLQGMRASVVGAHRLSSSGSRAPEHRLSNCGTQS